MLVFGLGLAQAPAQCTPQLLPMGGFAGTDGGVYASLAYDPDGPGPLSPRLVIGGEFHTAGSVVAEGIAEWDEATGVWTALGSGMNGRVQSLARLPNGDLVAGGMFTTAGGVVTNGIAQWNGSTWLPLGAGFGGGFFGGREVLALAVLPNGDLAAGGNFQTAGGVACRGIARWNGSSWAPLGTGVLGTVRALTVLSNGDLAVAGDFNTVGITVVAGVPQGVVGAAGIARWNGGAWSAIGVGAGAPTSVASLLELPNGDLVAGGAFTAMGGAPAEKIAQWNGTTWSPLGSGIAGTIGYVTVPALARLANGDLVAAASVTVSGSTFPMVMLRRWNGTAWSPYGASIESSPLGESGVFTLATLSNGDLAVGGRFGQAGGVPAANLARTTPTSLTALAGGTDGGVAALAALPDGSLVAGGAFTSIGGVAANRIARWNGTWAPLGSGCPDEVASLLVAGNGDLIVGGKFWSAGGAAASQVARWNGTSWSGFGSGVTSGLTVYALAEQANGDVLIGGDFGSVGNQAIRCVARWNGVAWSEVGVGSFANYGTTYALAILPNGDLVAGGRFGNPAGAPPTLLTRWNGATWTPLLIGNFGDVVRALVVLPNGALLAGGRFAAAGGVAASNVALWNGTTWAPLAGGTDGEVAALAVLPNGDVVAGGDFQHAGGAAAVRFARWNGTTWAPFVAGFDRPVAALAFQRDGRLWAGGTFRLVGGVASTGAVALGATCPATAAAYGSSCIGSPTTALVAQAMPWLGGTFRGLATGVAGNALVLVVHGLTPLAAPLPTLLPQGVGGCSLWVSPDLLDVALPAGNTVATQFAVPNAAVLVGQSLREQVVPFAFDVAGNLLAVTSTNALLLTIGAF